MSPSMTALTVVFQRTLASGYSAICPLSEPGSSRRTPCPSRKPAPAWSTAHQSVNRPGRGRGFLQPVHGPQHRRPGSAPARWPSHLAGGGSRGAPDRWGWCIPACAGTASRCPLRRRLARGGVRPTRSGIPSGEAGASAWETSCPPVHYGLCSLFGLACMPPSVTPVTSDF